jgi:hypothetical protein
MVGYYAMLLQATTFFSQFLFIILLLGLLANVVWMQGWKFFIQQQQLITILTKNNYVVKCQVWSSIFINLLAIASTLCCNGQGPSD